MRAKVRAFLDVSRMSRAALARGIQRDHQWMTEF
jgi:hypothetical protein